MATDQGVPLAGPFTDWPRALFARERVVAQLRADLERERRSADFVAARCAAVAVRWGVLVGAWQRFQPLE